MKVLSQLVVATLILLETFFLAKAFGAEKNLSLQDYLQSVASNNSGYKAAHYMSKALELRVGEASSDFMTKLVGDFGYVDNHLLQISPFGASSQSWKGSLGVQTKFRTGTTVNLSYANNYMNSAAAGFINQYTFFLDGASLTLTQPLWQDFFGAMSKASEQLQLATINAQGLQQQYLKQQIVFNAETAYWRVALFREIVNFDKEALERTQKIYNWNKKRVSMNVADKTDLLQAQAAMKMRQLQLQTDTEQLRQFSSQFNAMRNIPGDMVPESLSHIDVALNSKIISELKKTADRFDVQSALQNASAQKAQADLNREKFKPTLNLTGNVQTSGRDVQSLSTAITNSLNMNNPYYSVGLTMSVPLEFGTISDINEGNRAAAMAAQYSADKAKFDLEQDWLDLQKKFKDVLIRFEMAKSLEELQKEKLEHERSRFTNGRTTSFQVLQFEDNYSDAQLNRLRIENDAITLRATARLYNGGTL